MKKNPFTTVGQIKNTLQEVGILLSLPKKTRKTATKSMVVVYRDKVMMITYMDLTLKLKYLSNVSVSRL